MSPRPPSPRKPKALREGSTIAWFAPGSPPSIPPEQFAGLAELRRLGFKDVESHKLRPDGYFAAPLAERLDGFWHAVNRPDIAGLIGLRGGYGSTYLLG